MNTPTEEQIQDAKKFIKRDPERAAWQLAELSNRIVEADKALSAIRSFSQNIWIARDGTREQIEHAIGRKL